MNIRMAGCRACEQITSGDCGMHGPLFIPTTLTASGNWYPIPQAAPSGAPDWLAASPPETAPAQTFNLNEYVWVKVLERGFVILADDDEALNTKLRPVQNAPLFNRADAVFKEQEHNGGWSKWQLWSLMQAFGAHISLGCSPPFETEIRLAAHGSRPAGRPEKQVGCERPDGTLNIHSVSVTCDICAGTPETET